MVVGTKALGASLGEATIGADLGGSSKLSKHFRPHISTCISVSFQT